MNKNKKKETNILKYIFKIILVIIFIYIILFILDLLGIIHISNTLFFNYDNNEKIIISKKENLIPRIIYRIWIGGKIPEKYQKARDFTKKHNPNYQQIIYNDDDIDNFLKTYYKNHSIWGDHIYNAYNKINPKIRAARADFFRYLLLYEKGGIYLDIKSASRNLDSIIKEDDTFLCSRWHSLHSYSIGSRLFVNGGEIQQWWIAIKPKHELFKILINNIIDNINNYKKEKDVINNCKLLKNSNWNLFGKLHQMHNGSIGNDVHYTTGPFIYTKVIEQYNKDNKGIRILNANGNDMFIYDYNNTHKGGQSYRNLCEPLVI